MDNPTPLTNEEIRQELQKRKDKTIELGVEMLALQELLIEKGILSRAEVIEANLKQARKLKEGILLVVDSMQKPPPEDVQ